jgi:catechol 2,3-dioxygenase-like lactoylglutathione lyase family enzyme
MSAEIRCVDHPVIAVSDLGAAYHAYRRLGFTIPPPGRHLEWGTGNWCIMFPDDYLELRGITDPTRYTHDLDTRLATYGEGLMGVAFAPQVSAARSQAAGAKAGIAIKSPHNLTRRFSLPEGEAFPSFQIASVDPAALSVLENVVICEHRSPEIIRRPEWLSHPNGAIGVGKLCGVAADLGRVAGDFGRFFGADLLDTGDTHVHVRPPSGAAIEIALDRAALRPQLTGLEVEVAALAQTATILAANQIPFERQSGVIEVGPDWTCGVALRLRQAGG